MKESTIGAILPHLGAEFLRHFAKPVPKTLGESAEQRQLVGIGADTGEMHPDVGHLGDRAVAGGEFARVHVDT